MLLRIAREVCLAKYRNFPLSPFDVNTYEEFFYYPKIISGGWYYLHSNTKREFSNILKMEFTKLIRACKFESLIFFGDKTTPWVTKLSAKRTDYVSIIKAIEYFEINQLGKKFNGGVQVGITDLPEFIKHFYSIVRSDASFHGFYFSDENQKLLGSIHYSGEVLFQTLDLEFNSQFEKYLRSTQFKFDKK